MLGWELPPYNSGGLGVACYHICKHVARKRIKIEFVLPYQLAEKLPFMELHSVTSLHPNEFVWGAYKSHFIDVPGTRNVSTLQKRYVQFVERLVQKKTYDAIHAHDWLTFRAGLRAKELTGKPLIAHVHATEFDRAGLNRGNELVHEIEAHALAMADSIIAVSELTKAQIVREYGIPADKIEVIHNAIDPDDFPVLDPDNAHHYLTEMKKLGYKVVVSIGRLSLQKGLTHLLMAARRVVEKNNKVLFVIVGDGELRNELIEMTAAYGITQNVIFTGFLRGKRWRDSFAIADMFVMPSISEPFGLSALEAANYNNAVLLSRACGVSEVLRSVMQFDIWDTEKLANEILTIAEHPFLQATLADNVQNEIANLTWDNAAQKFDALYKKHARPYVKAAA